jgi:hypothetical protein
LKEEEKREEEATLMRVDGRKSMLNNGFTKSFLKSYSSISGYFDTSLALLFTTCDDGIHSALI